MVVLQSKNYDVSTNTVLEWLLHYNKPFVRINDEEQVDITSFTISGDSGIDVSLKVGDKDFLLSQVTAYWQRRGKLHVRYDKNMEECFERVFSKKFSSKVQRNFSMQFATLDSYINDRMGRIGRSIGHTELSVINKLTMLEMAIACGLKVPDGIITNSKSELLKFRDSKKGVVTKAILDSLFVWDDDFNIVHYTEKIEDEGLEKIPESFAFSLFQEMVPKKFELRTFVMPGKFYSMAIFSQNDSQTNVDFRKYNDSKPNRTTPFLLPVAIENNITALFNRLGLQSGSVDMIFSENDEYVFLEINPVGQFAMVSYPCNYYIERELANWFTQKNTV